MKNILITSVGGDIGMNIVNILLSQNIFKCNLVAVDIKEYVYSKQLVNKFYIVPRIDNEDYLREIDNIISLNNIDLIIPSSEMDILFFDSKKDFFLNRNIKLLINKTDIIKNFLDKEQTSIALNELGIKTPITYSLNEYNNQLEFPVIIKAKKSTISKMIKVVNNEEEFKNIKNKLQKENDYIIQEYIGDINEEYTTTVYKDKNNIKSISFRRDLDGDKTGFAEIIKSKELEDYCFKIAEHYNLYGSINIQSRKRNDNFYIFEINPRISSTVFIRNHFNFRDLLWWICSLLDIQYEFEKVNKSGIAVIGYTYNFY